MQLRYPDEHILIANPECPPDTPGNIVTGEVLDHDPLLDALLDRCNLPAVDTYAIKYTGDLGKAIGQRGMVRVIEHD